MPNSKFQFAEFKNLYLDVENRGLHQRNPNLQPGVCKRLPKLGLGSNQRLNTGSWAVRYLGC